jgi:hypothetical protein
MTHTLQKNFGKRKDLRRIVKVRTLRGTTRIHMVFCGRQECTQGGGGGAPRLQAPQKNTPKTEI